MPRLTKIESKPVVCWGLEWRSRSKLSGARRCIIHSDLMPALFKTRREARDFQKLRYGYIAKRPDLRAEPHGWTVPAVVRIECRAIA